MVRLNSFEAVRCRGINALFLPRPSKADLITGANGVGKAAPIEAMWLFTGRYNPGLLRTANVQRSSGPILDPISRLAGNELELRGVGNETPHELKPIFEKMEAVSPGSKDQWCH